VVGRLFTDWKRINAPSRITLFVPTCQRDRKTGGRDWKRHTYLPGCGIVGFFSVVVVTVRVLDTTVVVVVEVDDGSVVVVEPATVVVVVEPATVVVVTGIVVVEVVVGTEVFTLILT
jgi:hypothetical protein